MAAKTASSRITYEEFLLTTNGLQNHIALRFVNLYQTLLGSPLAVRTIVERNPGMTRQNVYYLVGSTGKPQCPTNRWFQQFGATWGLSEDGTLIEDYVAELSENIKSDSRSLEAGHQTSISPSQARVEVFEKSYEEAKEELTKNLEWLSFDDPSKFIQHIRNLIKQSPKVEQYFADEMETWVITPEEEIYDEKTLKRAVVHAMKEFIFLSGQLDAYRAGKLKLGRAPVEI